MGVDGFSEGLKLGFRIGFSASRYIEDLIAEKDYSKAAEFCFSLAQSLIEQPSSLDNDIIRDASELCKQAEKAYQMAINQQPAPQHYWVPKKLLPYYQEKLEEIRKFKENYNL